MTEAEEYLDDLVTRAGKFDDIRSWVQWCEDGLGSEEECYKEILSIVVSYERLKRKNEVS